MSKRTRYADNSKRRQPVQQQRAQAALKALSQKKTATPASDQQETREGSAARKGR